MKLLLWITFLLNIHVLYIDENSLFSIFIWLKTVSTKITTNEITRKNNIGNSNDENIDKENEYGTTHLLKSIFKFLIEGDIDVNEKKNKEESTR
ncbi:hypothetical protein U3516DRAFT_732525 [Neocallimastix sp. 'constans']